MNAIEKVKKSLEEANRKAAAQVAILESLPAFLQCPEHVTMQMPAKHLREQMEFFPWLTYEVNTVEEALLLAELFGSLYPVESRRKSCVSVQPVVYMEKEYLDGELEWEVQECIVLRQNSGEGHSSCEIVFWPTQYNCRVAVEIKNNLPRHLRSTITYRCDVRACAKIGERHFIRLTDNSHSWGSNNWLDYSSYFEGVDHALRVLCAEEGYL